MLRFFAVKTFHRRHFSLDEARQLLPWVRDRLRRLQGCIHVLERRGFRFFGGEPIELELQDIGFSLNGQGKHTFPLEYLEMIQILEQITSQGVMIKSATEGLIDFPAFAPWGEEVYLCYLEGESDIAYWHSLTTGFQGRQPVEGTFLPKGHSPGMESHH